MNNTEQLFINVLGALLIFIGVLFLLQGIDLIRIVLFDCHYSFETSKKLVNKAYDCNLIRIAGASFMMFLVACIGGAHVLLANRDK